MKQEERRNRSTEKLIQAYLELAAEQGVASITFDSIGQRAGYSRGLAFQKFGSKDGLLEAVISYLHEEGDRIRAESHSAGDDGLTDLVLLCRHHLHALQNGYENKAYFVLLSSAIAERSDLRTQFEQSHARSEVIISGLIKQGQADGSIRTDIDPKQTALLVGTPALSLIGAVGAALTLGVRGGAVLLCILVLPLSIPVLVFGASAGAAADAGLNVAPHFSLLGACLAMSLCVCPLATAAGLRIAME